MIAVHDHGGTGPAVLLLHGGGRTMGDWRRVVPLLVPHHRVVAMDLRGHGGSPPAADPWDFDQAVADVEQVAERAGLGRPFVVGHSLGGMVAALYGVGHPECPGVVNIDGVGMLVPERFPGPDPAAARRLVLDLIETLTAGEPVGDVPVAVEAFDVLAVTGRVRCPLLHVGAAGHGGGGPDDAMWLWAEAVRLEVEAIGREHPNVRYAEVASGHMVPLEAPGELARLLLEFTGASPAT